MTLPTFSVGDLHTILPELFICASAFTLLMADLFIDAKRRALIHFLAIAVLAAAVLLTVRDMVSVSATAFGGMFVRDIAGDVLKIAVYAVTAFAFVYAKPYLLDRGLFKSEYYVLCLFSVLGMMLMISSGNLTVLYLGLELLALSSYGLVGLDRDNPLVSEAAMKYFVLGSIASGLLLYGMSMVYGATGSLQFDAIYAAAGQTDSPYMFKLGVAFMLAGIAFKFGAAPFHMWLPDVYQGAPTAVVAFISSAPKLAAFAMAYRLLESAAGVASVDWVPLVAGLSALSLLLGNLMALVQTNFKRLLAYSTISHVGFLLLGLLSADAPGYAASMFYAISYSIMAVAAFGSIILLSRSGFEACDIEDFRGLWVKNPGYAFLVLFVIASLAGIPPFLGFFAKLQVIVAALQGGYQWLAILAVVSAVIGAFYYLKLIRVMFFEKPDSDSVQVNADNHLRAAFAVNAAALLVLGVFSNGILAWCIKAFPA
ncbi:MAG: NADH-quinone oxidoreductase subunit NuoN [Arenimonas sp.]|nr:NADH-quinone oxidoreductase subunit NuoN [Arenimonas sp.]